MGVFVLSPWKRTILREIWGVRSALIYCWQHIPLSSKINKRQLDDKIRSK